MTTSTSDTKAPAFDPTQPFKTRDGRPAQISRSFSASGEHHGDIEGRSCIWSFSGRSGGEDEDLADDLINVEPDTPAQVQAPERPAAGVSEAEVEAAALKINPYIMGPFGDAEMYEPARRSIRRIAREAIEAAALVRQPAHDTGQGAVAWQWRRNDQSSWEDAPSEQSALRWASCRSGASVRPLYAAPQTPVPGGQSDGWRPIADAPKALAVLVRCGPTYDVAYQTNNGAPFKETWRFAGSENRGRQLDYWPTHWAFLPRQTFPDPPGTAPAPAPSNAGEDEGAFIRFIISRNNCSNGLASLSGNEIARLIDIARRGLSAPARPAGGEVTEAIAAEREACAQVAAEYSFGRPQGPEWGLMEDVERDEFYVKQRAAVSAGKAIAAALRARTGR